MSEGVSLRELIRSCRDNFEADDEEIRTMIALALRRTAQGGYLIREIIAIPSVPHIGFVMAILNKIYQEQNADANAIFVCIDTWAYPVHVEDQLRAEVRDLPVREAVQRLGELLENMPRPADYPAEQRCERSFYVAAADNGDYEQAQQRRGLQYELKFSEPDEEGDPFYESALAVLGDSLRRISERVG